MSAAEAEQIIKKRTSGKSTRKEIYELTENYTKTVPPIKDYAGLRKKLEKIPLPEHSKVLLINLAPTTKQEISEYIPGGDELNDETVNEIIRIVKEELENARHIRTEVMDVESDVGDDI